MGVLKVCEIIHGMESAMAATLDLQCSPMSSRGPVTQENPNNANIIKYPYRIASRSKLRMSNKFFFIYFPHPYPTPTPIHPTPTHVPRPKEEVHRLVPQGLLIAIMLPNLKRCTSLDMPTVGLLQSLVFLFWGDILLKALLGGRSPFGFNHTDWDRQHL